MFERQVLLPPQRRRAWPWMLGTNLVLLAGVTVFGWPAGNVLLLFWVENVLLGLVTLLMILTARGRPRPGQAPRRANRAGTAVFFTFHYGLFCAVHLVFTAILANLAGLVPTFEALGLPALLIAVRYLAEFGHGWILGDGRLRATPDDVFGLPYPRMIVLHVVTLLGWGAMFYFRFGSLFPGGESRVSSAGVWGLVRGWFEALGVQPTLPVVLVTLLVVVKTVVELIVSRRGMDDVHRRPGRLTDATASGSGCGSGAGRRPESGRTPTASGPISEGGVRCGRLGRRCAGPLLPRGATRPARRSASASR